MHSKTNKLVIIALEARLDELSQINLDELPMNISNKILERRMFLKRELKKRQYYAMYINDAYNQLMGMDGVDDRRDDSPMHEGYTGEQEQG